MKIKVFPVAYDSFGVRSMATLVQVNKMNIFIDPGVALGPKRYGLPPTQQEEKALEISRKNVMKLAKKCKIAIVSHYHYDHHPYPEDDEMYKACFWGKKVFAKDIKQNINLSGKKRGKIFESKVKDKAELVYADGKTFELDGILLEFSPAVWHGDVGSKVGMVIMVYIQKGKHSFLFGSDAQSLADPKALKWVLEKNPEFLILDGYPTIFVGWRMAQKSFEKAKQNLKKAVEKVEAKTIILDHHILRDIDYKQKMKDVFELAESLGKKLVSAAEFYGMENLFLEAWRKDIHEGRLQPKVETFFRKLSRKFKEIKLK